MPPMTRAEVFQAIEGERRHATARWGVPADGVVQELPKSVDAHVLLMEGLVEDARDALRRDPSDTRALDFLREAVGVGIACFEQHGVPLRPTTPVVNKRDNLTYDPTSGKCLMPGKRKPQKDAPAT